MQIRSFNDWLFFACIVFVGGAIVMLTIGTLGCAVSATIIVAIIATDESEQKTVYDLSVPTDPSVDS